MIHNIAEILKDCPKGTKLYTVTHGWGSFDKIDNEGNITIDTRSGSIVFNKYGCETPDGECSLYPSKDELDWDTFNDPYSFKLFDKVIGKERGVIWKLDIFTHYIKGSVLPYQCIAGTYCECLPYNEETAKLVGTMICYGR